MTWHECKSSNVDAFSYDKEGRWLYIRFIDGTIYRWTHSPEQLADFVQSESKGSYISNLVTGERMGAVQTEQKAKGILNTYQEDSCCGPRLSAALRKGIKEDIWECPRCTVIWRARIIGEIRRWEPDPNVSVFKLPTRR